MNITRRNFIKTAAAVSLPAIVPSTVFGADAPSKKITVGHIGVGGQGGGLLRGFLGCREGRSLAVCDAFKGRMDQKAAQIDKAYKSEAGKGCRKVGDFRELIACDDIDAVVVATPDHWHVPISLAAVKAGKDVYCEKPLGLSIEQNKAMRAAVHKYGTMFQYGTQQRSFNTHCAKMCELVINGYIGELKEIHVTAPNGKKGGNPKPMPVPADLDYNMWLGPAPEAPYTKDRVIGGGRWYIYDYALGFIAGWGAHPLDIAHWGYPHIPVEIEGTGVIPTEGLFNTIINWQLKGVYESGVKFTMGCGRDSTKFVGTEGWVQASRGGHSTSSPELKKITLKPDDKRLLQDNHHYRNFLKSCQTRKTPVSNIDSAVQSDFISHLGDIAIRTGRKIKWDPKKETIVGDEAAAKMMTRAMRAPWTL